MENPTEIYKLVIGITLSVAFIFTVFITLASLVGWVKFRYPSQQKVLFTTLVVELVTGGIGAYKQMIGINPSETQKKIEKPLVEKAEKLVLESKKTEQELYAIKEESSKQISALSELNNQREKQFADITSERTSYMQKTEALIAENKVFREAIEQTGNMDDHRREVSSLKDKTTQMIGVIEEQQTHISELQKLNDRLLKKNETIPQKIKDTARPRF